MSFRSKGRGCPSTIRCVSSVQVGISMTKTMIELAGAMLMAVALCACSSQQNTLTTGMTPSQAEAAMGAPDLRDNVADPNHNGATVLRYTWLNAGKSAVFDSNNHVASVQTVEASSPEAEEAREQSMGSNFDPIATPLDYVFYPVRVAFIYIGAGLNCVGGGGCAKPHLPPVSRG